MKMKSRGNQCQMTTSKKSSEKQSSVNQGKTSNILSEKRQENHGNVCENYIKETTIIFVWQLSQKEGVIKTIVW